MLVHNRTFAAVFILIAFACHAKRFEIAIVFLLSLLLVLFLDGRAKILSVFNLSLPKTRVICIKLVSLDTLANIFVLVLFSVIAGVGGQFLFNMYVEFIEDCLVCLTSSEWVCLKLQFTVWIMFLSKVICSNLQ